MLSPDIAGYGVDQSCYLIVAVCSFSVNVVLQMAVWSAAGTR